MNEESEHEDHEQEPEQDQRTSSEIRNGINARINAARKFDIK